MLSASAHLLVLKYGAFGGVWGKKSTMGEGEHANEH